MKNLAIVEFRCPHHEPPVQAGCPGCDFLRATSREADQLRQRRASMLARIKQQILDKTIIIAEIQ